MVQTRAYQVNPGGNTRTHIHANDAEKTLLEIIAPELEKEHCWKDVEPYRNRTSNLDVHSYMGEYPKALVFNAADHPKVLQLSEKLEAALIMAGVLNRTAKAVYNGSVLYGQNPVIIVNEAGRERLETYIAEIKKEKAAGYRIG